MRRCRWWVGIAVLVIAAGCESPPTSNGTVWAGDATLGTDTTSGTDTSSGGDVSATPSTIPIEQLASHVAAAFCEAAVKCGAGDKLSFADPANCKKLVQQLEFDQQFAQLQADVKAGKIKYDGAKAAQCIAALKASCTSMSGDSTAPAACRETMQGTVAVGGACDDNDVCAKGYCNKGGKSDSCAGSCAALLKVGGECDFTSQCEIGLYCVASKCATEKATPAGKGESCDQTDCAAGLFCDYMAAQAVCKEQLAAGAACMGADECQGGSICKLDKATGKNTCGTLGKEGEACKTPTFAPIGQTGCEPGLTCATSGTGKDIKAVCLPRRKLGEACESQFQCGGIDAGCIGGKCALLPVKGGACEPGGFEQGIAFACMMPSVCDPTTKKCVDAPGAGQACIEKSCAKDLDCDQDNKCQPLPGKGAACSYECAKGLDCIENKCVEPVCS